MRLVLLLLLALAVSIALIVFPDIADQALRIEAFGWIFETRQGAFIVALLALLLLFWLLRNIVAALFAGPGVAWRSLRLGSRKRREKRLRELALQWINGRSHINIKGLKRCRGILPDWMVGLLQVMATPVSDLPMPGDDQDDLLTVMTARRVTDPENEQSIDLATRKAHLEAWLKVCPDAPLALSRMADLAGEEGDLSAFINQLEADWKLGRRSAETAKPRLVHACLKLAEQQPEQALDYLRKAYRLLPDHAEVLLAYGQALLDKGDIKMAQRLWSEFLEQHSHYRIARALLELQRDDPIRAYRKLERKKADMLNPAQRWLRAELAHAGKLDGLAMEQMQALAEDCDSVVAWNSLGRWHEAQEAFDQAASCYRRALVKQLAE